MPTYDRTDLFDRDLERLTAADRGRFARRVFNEFVADLREMERGRQPWFRPGLRVKKLKGVRDTYEMTWAPNGRATFVWGEEVEAGLRHVVWQRIGGHDILP